jgi:hypothetical protein
MGPNLAECKLDPVSDYLVCIEHGGILMPTETKFDPANFDFANLVATVHEHGVPPGVTPPTSIIRTDQDWSVHVSFDNIGATTGMIGGEYDVHLYLEIWGPAVDLDLTDPADHVIPLVPGPAPVSYNFEIDIPAGAVTAPDEGGTLANVIVAITYRNLAGDPDHIAAHIETGTIQFFNPA